MPSARVPALAAVAVLGTVPALAVASGPGDARVAQGAELYARLCASCHGPGGRGDGPVARALQPAPPDLTRIAARHQWRYPDNWVYRVIDGREQLIAHGPRDMPVWGIQLWREQGADVSAGMRTRDAIAALVAYLRTLQVARSPDDPVPR